MSYPADGNEDVKEDEGDNERVELRPPLNLLFASASFAKRYGMDTFLSTIMDSLKSRICIEDFETIMSLAIQVDITPVRLACLLFARESTEIKTSFDNNKFAS